MSFSFNPSQGPIVVEASLSGPMGQADVRLILDTGATTSLIRSTILIAVGYDPDNSPIASQWRWATASSLSRGSRSIGFRYWDDIGLPSRCWPTLSRPPRGSMACSA